MVLIFFFFQLKKPPKQTKCQTNRNQAKNHPQTKILNNLPYWVLEVLTFGMYFVTIG